MDINGHLSLFNCDQEDFSVTVEQWTKFKKPASGELHRSDGMNFKKKAKYIFCLTFDALDNQTGEGAHGRQKQLG